MVDTYGRWTYEPDTPEEKKCDSDRIADAIVKSGYEIKTTIEHLVNMIILIFDCLDIYNGYNGEYGTEWSVEGCLQYVEDSGGFAEFDYYD